MTDVVLSAILAVPYETYVKQPDGTFLPQTSSPTIIAEMLRLLGVEPGMRILEVGTGSGYSTALLATLTGASGAVISIDIDAALVERATQRLATQGFYWVKVITADGRLGHAAAAPFDRVIVWATGDGLPAAWVEQLHPTGLIVAPIRLLPIADTTAVIRFRLEASGTPSGERLISGGFVRLSDQARYQWRGHAEEADLAVLDHNQPIAWVSAEWLRNQAIDYQPAFLQMLLTVVPKNSPLQPDEDVEALRAYLFATHPPGLTAAKTPVLEWGAIGCSQPDSIALLTQRDHHYAEGGTSAAAMALQHWISDWRAAGRPGFNQLRAVCEATASGWNVQAILLHQTIEN